MIQTIRHFLMLGALCALAASPLIARADATDAKDVVEAFAVGNTRFKAQDFLGAYAKWRVAADQGHAGAANNIGHLLRNALGVKQDFPAALKWFHKGADGGDATAMYNLGLMYEGGQGVKTDKAVAIKWFRKSEAAGHKGAKAAIARASAKPKPKVTPKRKKATPRRGSGEPIIGEIRIVGFNFAPRGWADCDGRLLPIAKHSALFSILGTVYGGDGRTTFGLPDLRGRSPVHPGTDTTNRVLRLGQKSGGGKAAPAANARNLAVYGLGLRYVIALQGTFPSRSKRASADRYVGEVVMFAGNFSPNGWLPCEGQELVASENKVAFSVLGTTYRGTKSIFHVPDMRGRVLVHAGHGRGMGPLDLGRVERGTALGVPTSGSTAGVTLPSQLGIRHLIVMDGVHPSGDVEPSFLAEIRIFAGKVTPRGWIPCDGALLAISQHNALFSLYGTIFGGDGRTTFGIPDLRGRRSVGSGRGPGLEPMRLGQRWKLVAANTTSLEKSIHSRETVAVRYLARQVGIYPSRN